MDSIVLQNTFNSLLPINGEKCKNILKSIDKNYKEIECYTNECIYIGHCEIVDYETGIKARSRPKIGKSRYLTSLNRGRSQGGCEWIFDYIYFVPQGKNYSELEAIIHKNLKKYNLNKDNHRELYNLTIQESIDKVKCIIENSDFKI